MQSLLVFLFIDLANFLDQEKFNSQLWESGGSRFADHCLEAEVRESRGNLTKAEYEVKRQPDLYYLHLLYLN